MSLESDAMLMLEQLMQMDDKVLEEGYDDLLKLFDNEGNFEQAVVEKTAYCRANNMTIEDLIEENKLAEEKLPKELDVLSEPKRKLLKYLMSAATRINDKIMEKGLHSTAKLRIQRLPNNEKMPAYAHVEGDSGMDVYATEDIIINPRSVVLSGLGIKTVVPLGFELQVRPRSGMSLNEAYLSLFIANSPGTIDANYRHEVGIILKNIGEFPIAISRGTKFAQLVLCPVTKAIIEEISDVNDYPTDRTGGFGSSGDK